MRIQRIVGRFVQFDPVIRVRINDVIEGSVFLEYLVDIGALRECQHQDVLETARMVFGCLGGKKQPLRFHRMAPANGVESLDAGGRDLPASAGDRNVLVSFKLDHNSVGNVSVIPIEIPRFRVRCRCQECHDANACKEYNPAAAASRLQHSSSSRAWEPGGGGTDPAGWM